MGIHKISKATDTRAERAVIMYGPPGCGKTHHAKDIARAFRCAEVVDDWEYCPTPFVPLLRRGALHITNKRPADLPEYPAESVLMISFDAALAAAFVVGAV